MRESLSRKLPPFAVAPRKHNAPLEPAQLQEQPHLSDKRLTKMLQFKPQQPVSPEPPENRWSIGIDRRHVAVYVAISLVIGFVIGFISARYNQKKETAQLITDKSPASESRSNALPDNATSEFHRVSRVVRADTVEVDGIGVVKLLGIETPDGKS